MPGIGSGHAVAAKELPPLHADPFDQLLVAPALVEPMRLMTHDTQVACDRGTVIRIRRLPLPDRLPPRDVHRKPLSTGCDCGPMLKRIGENGSRTLNDSPGVFT